MPLHAIITAQLLEGAQEVITMHGGGTSGSTNYYGSAGSGTYNTSYYWYDYGTGWPYTNNTVPNINDPNYDPTWYYWWTSGAGTPTVGTGSLTDANGYYYSKIAELQNDLQTDPYFLTPCKYLDQFKTLGNFLPGQSVIDRINNIKLQYSQHIKILKDPLTGFPIDEIKPELYVQTLNDAGGSIVNCDYFPVHITSLPYINNVQLTPQELLNYFRKNFNTFIDNSIATFSPYADAVVDDNALWNSDNPLGAMLHLKMLNDGTVIVSDYQISNLNTLNNHFTVTTMCTPLDGLHPVSGNRSWGIQPDINGGYTFYVQGVDRITTSFIQLLDDVGSLFGPNGMDMADKLWRSLQDGMIKFIKDNGGNAEKYQTPDIILRTDFDAVKQFFQGVISKDELKKKLGC